MDIPVINNNCDINIQRITSWISLLTIFSSSSEVRMLHALRTANKLTLQSVNFIKSPMFTSIWRDSKEFIFSEGINLLFHTDHKNFWNSKFATRIFFTWVVKQVYPAWMNALNSMALICTHCLIYFLSYLFEVGLNVWWLRIT